MPVTHPASILLATDGKPHSRRAEEWTFGIASTFRIPLTILHVRDSYLKQFYNEIYAQGRQEYLDHVDRELFVAAEKILSDIGVRLAVLGLECDFRVRYGDPLDEIMAEVSGRNYELVVVGGKRLSGIRRFCSWNLPARLQTKLVSASLLIVREKMS